MDESKANLSSVKKYINMSDQDLANLFLNKQPEKNLKFNDLAEKVTEICKIKNADDSLKYFYVSSIPDVEYAYFINRIFDRWGSLVGDHTKYGLKLENIIALYNKLLGENWKELNEQTAILQREFLSKDKKRNKSAEVNVEITKAIIDILQLINVQNINLTK